jgi:fructose-bisphosphate aldolase, class I
MDRSPRLNRLFAADGRAAVAAFDHGLFGEPAWLPPSRDIDGIVRTHAATGLDAMLLPEGPARILQSIPGPDKPALIMRADVTDSYRVERPQSQYSHPLADAALRAVRLDAACIIGTIITYPGDAHLYETSLRAVDALRAESAPYGLPLMVEVVALTITDGTPAVSNDTEIIATLCRQAMEVGADIVKTEPPAPASEMAEVVAAVGDVPVFVGSGARAPDEEIRERTRTLLAAGARGIQYGRNILAADDQVEMSRTLVEMAHAAA